MPSVALHGSALRIVLETNVVISGLLWRGTPYRLLEIVEQDANIEIISSVASEVVSPVSTPLAVPDDPDDDHVIAAAVVGNADLIVSGDKHLLSLGSYQGIRIVSPAEALLLIKA